MDRGVDIHYFTLASSNDSSKLAYLTVDNSLEMVKQYKESAIAPQLASPNNEGCCQFAPQVRYRAFGIVLKPYIDSQLAPQIPEKSIAS